MSDEKFEVGDAVIFVVRTGAFSSYDQWGKVSRVTAKGTVFITYRDDHQEKEFRNGRGLRRPTKNELAYRLWVRERPRGELVTPDFGYGWARYPKNAEGALFEKLDSPEKCRKAAAELLTLAEWWDNFPKNN